MPKLKPVQPSTFLLTLAALAGAALFGAAPAKAQSLEELADRWGRMHGAAIYCRVETAHDFGVSAINYFGRQTSGARLEALRERYGTMFLSNTRSAPSGAAGSSCAELRANMQGALAHMSR